MGHCNQFLHHDRYFQLYINYFHKNNLGMLRNFTNPSKPSLKAGLKNFCNSRALLILVILAVDNLNTPIEFQFFLKQLKVFGTML